MAVQFPTSYFINSGTKYRRKSNLIFSEMESGMYYIADPGATPYRTIPVVCGPMHEGDMESLLDWIETNEAEQIEIAIGQETFIGNIDPRVDVDAGTMADAPQLWRVTFQFMGVKQ